MTQEEKIRLGKLYKRYNQCRDAELDRFWKNSVFVWVFLALCFAAFGSLFKDHNMPTKAMDIANTSNETYYLSLSVISLIACILSWIWVWMARGLKAWYEVYETAIWDIESFKNEFNYPHQFTIDNYWGLKRSDCFIQRWFFDSKPFSPSKIVILIGWLLVIVWFIALVFSILSWLCNTGVICCLIPCCSGCKFWINWIFAFIIVDGLIGLLLIIRVMIISSTLRDRKHNDVFKYIREKLSDEDTLKHIYFEIKNVEVYFYLQHENVNDNYSKLKSLFKGIEFSNDRLYIIKCSFQDFYNHYQVVNSFRKLLKKDFELFHLKITNENTFLAIHSSNNILMRRIKDILKSQIIKNKLHKNKDELEYKIDYEILIKTSTIDIPITIINDLKINKEYTNK